MGSTAKALIKAEAAAELASRLESVIKSAAGNSDSLRASADTVERLLERFHGYRPRIDAALEDGTFPPDSRDAVLAVFGDLVRMTDSLRAQLHKAQSEQAPFMAGLAKARELAEDIQRRNRVQAERAKDEEAEEDAYRADVAERTVVIRERVTADAAPPMLTCCEHCGDPITLPTGEDNCAQCVSHRNRYGALPSQRVLNKRRRTHADA